jgi:RNase H-like domain found in reverse transcriptase
VTDDLKIDTETSYVHVLLQLSLQVSLQVSLHKSLHTSLRHTEWALKVAPRMSEDKVFKKLKDKLMTAPILKSADMSQPFEIQTDGSQTGTGAVLQRRDDNEVTRPVAHM